ncbi:hypothetical protein [Nannocystis exedens]|uniref:hypothetical protein n=1 Tax=Nannocystis exedens TaxID=54 RepID=UPI000C2ABAAF|nr:hypothetical protein [Nannocystis exedens]
MIEAEDLDADGDLDLVVGVDLLGHSHALLHDDGGFEIELVIRARRCTSPSRKISDVVIALHGHRSAGPLAIRRGPGTRLTSAAAQFA